MIWIVMTGVFCAGALAGSVYGYWLGRSDVIAEIEDWRPAVAQQDTSL